MDTVTEFVHYSVISEALKKQIQAIKLLTKHSPNNLHIIHKKSSEGPRF